MTLLELMLEPTDEEAGVVFETMNSKATPLRQFDLLRNSIFIRLPKTGDKFFADTWKHLEQSLGGVSYTALRDKPDDQFFYEYVIATLGGGVSKDALHRRWLTHVTERLGVAVDASFEKKFKANYVEPLARAGFLYPLAVAQKRQVTLYPSKKIVKLTDTDYALISELMAMSGGPAVPIVLKALIARESGALSDADFSAILLDLQSYLVRLMLTGEDFGPLRASMMVVASKLPTPIILTATRKALREGDWKTDAEVLSAASTVNLKKWTSASFFPVLRGIERQLSGISAHPLAFGNKAHSFTIEHIYPQTENVGLQWEADITKWKVSRDDMDAREYVLGNLTAVTGYDNKRNGTKPFIKKRDLIKGTARLKLHDSFLRLQSWKPTQIDARSAVLAKAAVKRWPRH